MPLELGAAFDRRILTVDQELSDPASPTLEDLRTEQLLASIAQLQQALLQMPAPVVNVAEPDLTAIVNAVTQLNGPATAEEIAQAVRAEITGDDRQPIEPVLEKLTEALERLDWRLKGIGGTGGGGGGVASHVQNVDGTSLDTRDAALTMRYEWTEVAAESVPLYIGSALPATETSASTWRIDKYTYITGPVGNAVPSVVQSATGAWDSRASLF